MTHIQTHTNLEASTAILFLSLSSLDYPAKSRYVSEVFHPTETLAQLPARPAFSLIAHDSIPKDWRPPHMGNEIF
jgi:hypothetical protein